MDKKRKYFVWKLDHPGRYYQFKPYVWYWVALYRIKESYVNIAYIIVAPVYRLAHRLEKIKEGERISLESIYNNSFNALVLHDNCEPTFLHNDHAKKEEKFTWGDVIKLIKDTSK